jgi:hypothetical protein
MYDFIIIGSGPCGLTIANTLLKENYKILIIDKNSNLGGCHSVHRVNGLFSEHSPRVYSDSYINFINILKEMDINFYDIFTKYDYNIYDIFKRLNQFLSIREYIILSLAFINLNDNYKKITVAEFMNNNNFSKKSYEIIDSICLTVDGIDSSKFILSSLLNMINMTGLYNFYEPIYPNDVGLFKLWEKYLLNNNVDILLNSKISNINKNNITINNKIIYGKNFIFACPPAAICNILKKSNYPLLFGDIYNWSIITSYIKYVSFTFHYDTIIDLPHYWGVTNETDWGIIFIIMSKYMIFNDIRSKTVISITLSKPPKNKDNIIDGTYNQLKNKDNIIDGTYNQLKNIFPNLPYPNNVIFGNDINTSFASTIHGYMDYKSKILDNYYTCGHHIGKSELEYNSLESAVINALYLCRKLTNKNIIIHKPTKLLTIIRIITLIFIVIIIKKVIVPYLYL